MSEKIILIEKGRYGTYTSELDDIIEEELDKLNSGEHLIITIKTPTKTIHGSY